MVPVRYIPVHGTGGLDSAEDWWRDGSDFCKAAGENGLQCEENIDPFYWDGKVDGIGILTVLTFGLYHDKHEVWIEGGLKLRSRLRLSKLEDRNLILHSHALQIAAYSNIPLNNIITVGSPVRKDMETYYDRLRKNCNRWMHIYDERWDKIALLGQFGDGRWFGSRHCNQAHENVRLKDIGHSKILHTPQGIGYWTSESWFEFLKQERRDAGGETVRPVSSVVGASAAEVGSYS